ncbi:helix-turn-helix transcriptional regulator [Lewinella sp. LCG006]|uniref:helix-turn-helix transcriptional regulator n=1 Tax=Lewinella sp. LCG006 TaxID=3231911 RepID=UPI0034602457
MALNRLALIRYRTIDKCLRNRSRRWTLDDLVEACSEMLYEYEGTDRPVSRRTIQYDLQMMRSDKLGYEAPIVVEQRKYYTYADPDYGILQGPLSTADLEQLGEAVAVLKQFQGFGHLQELGGLVQKLEDKVSAADSQQPIGIMLESNEGLRGLEYLEELYRAVRQQRVVRLTYQSFKAKQPSLVVVNPLLLREFNNRWFLLATKERETRILSFALDRIQGVTFPDLPFYPLPNFDPEAYYKNVVGVTVNAHRITKIRLSLDAKNAPYVLTKPLHPSQEIEEEHENGSVVVSIRVIPNFELERLLLGFGPGLCVLSPKRIQDRMKLLLKAALARYDKMTDAASRLE